MVSGVECIVPELGRKLSAESPTPDVSPKGQSGIAV